VPVRVCIYMYTCIRYLYIFIYIHGGTTTDRAACGRWRGCW
jgi:hypothetical protein